jgi:uncharacterized Zn-binding protein involved in type VI secretion
MPGATRETTDICTGTVLTPPQGTVYVNGQLWAVLGTPIQSHPPCPTPTIHCNAVMSGSSATVYAGGILVCRAGDA